MKLSVASAIVLMLGMAALPPAAMAVIPPPRVNPLAGQVKAVHDAQQKLDQARKGMLTLRRKVEAIYSVKPDYKAAKDALDKAKAEYDAETRKVIGTLQKDPEYAALLTKRDKAQAVIDQAHNPPAPSSSGDDPVKLTDDEINAAVKDHQDAALAMIDLQKKAEENDPNIATLAQKKTDANTAWEAIQAQIDDALKSDTGYMPAQQAVDQAEAALKQARDSLAAASKAQRDAQDAAIRAKSASGGR